MYKKTCQEKRLFLRKSLTQLVTRDTISLDDISLNDIKGQDILEDTLTDSTYLILLALLEPQHGYAIMKEVNSLTNGQVDIGPASMYTILKKLQKSELITLEESSERKKIYLITEKGLENLKRDIKRRKLLYQAGNRLLAEKGRNE
ncbi:PadR family transcriptional regulator [Enterococcus silesiacus]